MKSLALIALPMLIATPSLAADLDGPRYSEREYFERREVEREAPPRVIEREVAPPKIVEHRHYHHNVQPRVYTEERILPPRFYTEERIYRAPRVYGF
jgi:hypothetical protein